MKIFTLFLSSLFIVSLAYSMETENESLIPENSFPQLFDLYLPEEISPEPEHTCFMCCGDPNQFPQDSVDVEQIWNDFFAEKK